MNKEENEFEIEEDEEKEIKERLKRLGYLD